MPQKQMFQVMQYNTAIRTQNKDTPYVLKFFIICINGEVNLKKLNIVDFKSKGT